MNTDLEKALSEAQSYTLNADQLATILATVAAVQAANTDVAQRRAPAPVRRGYTPGQILAAAGGATVFGMVLTGFFLAAAIAAAVAGTCTLVMYRVYKDIFGGKR